MMPVAHINGFCVCAPKHLYEIVILFDRHSSPTMAAQGVQRVIYCECSQMGLLSCRDTTAARPMTGLLGKLAKSRERKKGRQVKSGGKRRVYCETRKEMERLKD